MSQTEHCEAAAAVVAVAVVAAEVAGAAWCKIQVFMISGFFKTNTNILLLLFLFKKASSFFWEKKRSLKVKLSTDPFFHGTRTFRVRPGPIRWNNFTNIRCYCIKKYLCKGLNPVPLQPSNATSPEYRTKKKLFWPFLRNFYQEVNNFCSRQLNHWFLSTINQVTQFSVWTMIKKMLFKNGNSYVLINQQL